MPSFPSFYEAQRVKDVWVERAAIVAEEAAKAARTMRPASEDRVRIAAFGIDVQIGFCTPGASLFVPGAVEDTTRTIEWLYRNVDKITELVFSLDTHRVFQIFHPAFWVDREGKHPAPFTPITTKDVESGKWRPVAKPERCLEYVRKLEASGKYVLTIWPFHTLLGGVSHALVPAMMEASIFHALARQSPTVFETKGLHEMTESYSVLAPEVKELGDEKVGAFNEGLFERLLKFDRVYVFGQAKSHCVLSTLRDLKERIVAIDKTLLQKIWILEDAMSPVPAPPIDPLPAALDFPRIANEAFAELREAGMKIVKTTDPV